MPSLNILALVTDAFGGRGGIAQYNRDFLSSLVQGESAASVVVVPRLAPDPAVPPTGIVQVLPRLGRVAYAWKALRIALSQHFDVVLCGHLYMAPLALLIARLCGARFIIQTHGIEAWPRPTRRRLAAGEAADLILCVSRYTRARVLDWAAIPPERVLVVPNTVGEIFVPGDSTALRTAWGLQDKCVLLSVGRMVAHERYKGQDRTIAAIPKLVAAGLDVIYVVLGEGNDRPRLEESGACDWGRGSCAVHRRNGVGNIGCRLPNGRSFCHAVDGRRIRYHISRGDGMRNTGNRPQCRWCARCTWRRRFGASCHRNRV